MAEVDLPLSQQFAAAIAGLLKHSRETAFYENGTLTFTKRIDLEPAATLSGGKHRNRNRNRKTRRAIPRIRSNRLLRNVNIVSEMFT